MKGYGGFDNTWRYTGQSWIGPLITGTNDDHRGGGAFIQVYGPANSSTYTWATIQGSTFSDSGYEGTKSAGVHKVTEQITGIQIVNASQTNSLMAIAYGVK